MYAGPRTAVRKHRSHSGCPDLRGSAKPRAPAPKTVARRNHVDKTFQLDGSAPHPSRLLADLASPWSERRKKEPGHAEESAVQ